MKVTAEEFVRVWQSSRTVSEAAQRCGLSYQGAWGRARRMRDAGVHLQELGKTPRLTDANVAKLNEVIAGEAPPEP